MIEFNPVPKSSVLIIGHPQKERVQLGADCVDNLSLAEQHIIQNPYSTVVIPIKKFSLVELSTFTKNINDHSIDTHVILINDSDDYEKVCFLVNNLNVFQIVDSFNVNDFEKHVFSSTESYAQTKQAKQLYELFDDQNLKLKHLKLDLEERIEKRKARIKKSQHRFESLSKTLQALHKSLFIIHNSVTLAELESELSKIIKAHLSAQWVKVLFNAQNTTKEQILKANKSLNILSLPLMIQNKSIGFSLFAFDKSINLLKDDLSFLTQISEATALSADRISKRGQAESLKRQWEAAFNAISSPICLTNSNFQIIRTNKGFIEKKQTPLEEVSGHDCFDIFFQDPKALENQTPVEGKYFFQKNQTFLTEEQSITYEVSVQKVPYIEHEHDLWMVHFRDISEDIKLERQILELSKMAELGTISSSIAHELNNPLGGMISFLQLIKMDLTEGHKNYSDIEAMYTSALRCKGIIENLLGFARRSQGEMDQKINLREIMQQSINIFELQTRSTNINIEMHAPKEPLYITGNYNLLTQALCNILQNSVEAIKEKFKNSPRYDGQIRLELSATDGGISLVISDNGTGIEPQNQSQVFNPLFTTKNPDTNSGLGLTVSFQIISDHGGSLDIFSQPMAGTSAKISFSSSRFNRQEPSN